VGVGVGVGVGEGSGGDGEITVGVAVGVAEGVPGTGEVNVVVPVMTISSHCVTSVVVTLPPLCEVLLYEVNAVGGCPVTCSYTFALSFAVVETSNPARFCEVM
jgi:hypothetical protein